MELLNSNGISNQKGPFKKFFVPDLQKIIWEISDGQQQQQRLVNLHSRGKWGPGKTWHPLNRIRPAKLAAGSHPIHPSWPGLRNPNAGLSHILKKKICPFLLLATQIKVKGGDGGVAYPVTHMTVGNFSLTLSLAHTHTHTHKHCLSLSQHKMGLYVRLNPIFFSCDVWCEQKMVEVKKPEFEHWRTNKKCKKTSRSSLK